MHQNQKVIQFLLDNSTQFECHLSIQVVSPVSNFSDLGIIGILSIGSEPVQPWFWVMNQMSDQLKLSEHTLWCGSWPKITDLQFSAVNCHAGANFLRFWHDEVDRFPCHLFVSIWLVKSVTCKALDHLPVPESTWCWDPILEFWLGLNSKLFCRFHFRFIPWSLPLWLSLLGRHFWVAVLLYFCSTRVTGPAVLHCCLVFGDSDSLSVAG